MNTISADTIAAIVNWIKDHPDHIYENDDETFVNDSPAETWFRFCRDPRLVNEYEDPYDCVMGDNPAPHGCAYIFERGPLKGCACCCPTNSFHCKFHDHPIFVHEVRAVIKVMHATIDRSVNTKMKRDAPAVTALPALPSASSDTPLFPLPALPSATIGAPSTLPVLPVATVGGSLPTMPATTILSSVRVISEQKDRDRPLRIEVYQYKPGMYREKHKGLILRPVGDDVFCNEFIPPNSTDNVVQPLTPELVNYCLENNIVVKM